MSKLRNIHVCILVVILAAGIALGYMASGHLNYGNDDNGNRLSVADTNQALGFTAGEDREVITPLNSLAATISALVSNSSFDGDVEVVAPVSDRFSASTIFPSRAADTSNPLNVLPALGKTALDISSNPFASFDTPLVSGVVNAITNETGHSGNSPGNPWDVRNAAKNYSPMSGLNAIVHYLKSNTVNESQTGAGIVGFSQIIDLTNTSSYTLNFRMSPATWVSADGVGFTVMDTDISGKTPDGTGILGSASAIYGWDATTSKWLTLVPYGVNVPGATDATIRVGQVLWLHDNDLGMLTSVARSRTSARFVDPHIAMTQKNGGETGQLASDVEGSGLARIGVLGTTSIITELNALEDATSVYNIALSPADSVGTDTITATVHYPKPAANGSLYEALKSQNYGLATVNLSSLNSIVRAGPDLLVLLVVNAMVLLAIAASATWRDVKRLVNYATHEVHAAMTMTRTKATKLLGDPNRAADQLQPTEIRIAAVDGGAQRMNAGLAG